MTPNLSRNLKNTSNSNDPNNFKIFAGNTNHELAKQVCELMDVPLGQSQVNSFSDGEIQVEIKESVRGKLMSLSSKAHVHQ
jgi:phosphoribosylpyrophosphate synthetase